MLYARLRRGKYTVSRTVSIIGRPQTTREVLRTTISRITRVHVDYGMPVHLLFILCALIASRVCDRALPGAPGTLTPSPSTASVRAIVMPWCKGEGMARIGVDCYRQPCHQSIPYTAVVQYQRRGPWSQYYLNRSSPHGSEEVRK